MTTVIRGTDNTVSSPALTGDDGNTGIYFPAADQIAVSLNGVRSMLFTDSGALLETSSIPLTVNSTNSNAYKLAFQDNGVARGYIGANSSNAFKVANDSATDVLNVTSAGLFQMNSGYGSVATAYGCRAWIYISYSGATPFILGSAGVSGIVDDGTGTVTVSLSVTMPDVGYAVVGAAAGGLGGNASAVFGVTSVAASSFQVSTKQGGSFIDSVPTMVAIFR